MRPIDADALVVAIEKFFDGYGIYDVTPYTAVMDFESIVDNMPTIKTETVRHGHWKGKPIAGYGNVKCSACGMFYSENSGLWNYCPHCGAKMAEKE